jgi:methylmalonyl-CoA/ethylmalonyl-CoA epimerase
MLSQYLRRIIALEKLKKIVGIGIAVKDLEKATDLLCNCFGGRPGEVMEDPFSGMKFRMVRVADVDFELMEATMEEGPVGKFIHNRGEGLHHIAFAVDGVADRLNGLKNMGCRLIDEKPIEVLGVKTGFVHPKSFFGVMIELTEFPEGYSLPGSDPV